VNHLNATLRQVKAHLEELAAPYGLLVDVREIADDVRGRCVQGRLSNMRRDPPAQAWVTVTWREFERDGVAVCDDLMRAAPSLANA
jgi:hypothetical protein